MVQGAPQTAGRFDAEVRMYKSPPPEVSSEQFYETDPGKPYQRGFSIQTVSPLPITWAEHVAAQGHWGATLRAYMSDYVHWSCLGALCEFLPQPGQPGHPRRGEGPVRPARRPLRLLPVRQRHAAHAAPPRESWSRSCTRPGPTRSSPSIATPTWSAAPGWPPTSGTASSTRDCRSFAVPNLYITDGSVLPTQGSANPALTIMAVAARARRPAGRPGAPADRDIRQGDYRWLSPPSPTTCWSACATGVWTKVFAYPGDGINGILAAWGRADNQPKFIQARHEEMAAFEAVGYAKFTGRFGVCMATSGPGAIHLLNGLYDAKLDHVPVVAIVGQTSRSAMGGSYQQEVDLLSLFKDVASEYVQMVTVPEQLPNVLDRAIRVALAERAPTAIIIPSDVQELEYSAPTHAFKMVPSSLGHRLAHRRSRRRRDRPRGRDPQRRAARSPSWPARAPAAPGPSWSRSPTCSAPAWPSRCWARTCCPTNCRTSPARSACWAPGRATR